MAGAPKGNNNAAKGKIWSDAVRKCVLSGGKLDILARKLVALAEEGDLSALREIGDRLEGKPAQTIQGAGEYGEHLMDITAAERPKLTKEEWLKAHGLGTATGTAE